MRNISKKEGITIDELTELIPTSKNMMLNKGDKTLSTGQYLFEVGDASSVELEWIYKGEILKTIAIVSDKKGVVYDNLLFFILFHTNEVRTEEIVNTTPRLKSGYEKPDGLYDFKFREKQELTSLAGKIVVEWDLTCTIPLSLSNGKYTVLGYTSTKYCWADFFNSCAADIQKKGELMGVNGYVDFAWAVSYKFMGSVTIGWNGTGFTFSGGGTQLGGEIYANSQYFNSLP